MKFKKWFAPLVFSLVAVMIIWVAVSGQSPVRIREASNDPTLWVSGWHAETVLGDARALSLPARLQTAENIVARALPDSIQPGDYLYLKTNYQQVTAKIDSVTVNVLGIASTPGSTLSCDMPWSVLPLTPDMAGKTVRLMFSNSGSKPWVEVYSARLGSATEIRLALLSGALPSVVLSLLIALLAITLFLFALLEARRYHKHISPGYYHLLGFVLLSCVWFYTDTDIGGVYYLGNAVYFLVNYYSYMLFSIPFLLFIYAMQPSFRKVMMALSVLIVGNVVLHTALMLWGGFALWTALTSSHILLALTFGIIMLLVYGRKNRSPIPEELAVGVTITVVAGLFTMAFYYFLPIDDNSLVFRYGVLVLIITLTLSVLRSNVDLLMQARSIEQLRIHEEEYRIAVRQSDKHVLRYDVAQRILVQGEEDTQLFGVKRDIPNIPEAAIAAGVVAEESIADFRAFFDGMFVGKPSGTCACCLRNVNGTYSWYRADYTMIYTVDHKPLQAVISFYDITEQREKELAYQKWKQLYAEMPSTGMNYYEYNLTRDVFISEAGRMLPPLPPEAKRSLGTMIGSIAEKHVSPADEQKFREFFKQERLLEAYAHGVRSDKLEFRRLDSENRMCWTVASVQLISDPYSSDVQSFLLLQDEDEAKRDEMKARARSNNDPLTGLLNRSAFEEQLTELLEQIEPDGIHALIMVDVDGFKRVNDTFGHQFGDRVLIDIANSLRAMMRGDDLIGRIGGDEYMVCLKHVPESSGFLERRASFICQALNKQFGNDVAISGSVGLSLYPRDGRTFDELYQRADKALYYAKHHGKNRYVFFNGDLIKGDINAPSTQSLYAVPADPDVVAEAQKESVRTVLIVDDVEMNREILREIFKDDYHLILAENGQQCLKLMERSETAISAVLLDLIMPGMSGLEVLERIQKDAYMASIPVIVTSAADEVEFSLKAIELGATDFVGKPIDPRLVKLRVKNAIHKRETEELRAQNRYLLVQKSDESRHQNELRYLAEHDPLTNICNKASFYRKTRTMLDKFPDTRFVMIAFDIEKFRVINDIFGHEEGDRLLRYIAQRMQTLYAGRATYSRIDADNFALCLPFDRQLLKRRMAENEAELREYDLPFEIMLVFGLYIIDDITLPVSIMHDRAEMAKRTVKGNYVRRYAYYDEKLRKALLDELEIVNNMNAALQKKQFEIYLQPKCLLSTGEIIGAEALVRWNHPTRGVLMPGAFVPIFEKNGFIMKLDAYVWEQVCALIRKWMDSHNGKPPIPVSMNVSRVDMYNPALVNSLCSLADRYGVPRRYMELEITESAYAADPKQLSDLISELRSRGFLVEMDDFGSAYSSLNMLKEISVDVLKLDMCFLFGNNQDGRGGIILSSIVRMARYLALPIVAEGVETAEQARFLCSIGCTRGQGFYFYKPMPVADFEQLLASQVLKPLARPTEIDQTSALRRVWSIDGDFSLMLSTIPCAASLCELSRDTLEVLRVNDEYFALTGDDAERIYITGANARALSTEEDYRAILVLFRAALESQGSVEGGYWRVGSNGKRTKYHVKIRYLSGDAIRSLFFVTYEPDREGGECA